MPDPAVRRAYWARAEVIRQADRVLSVSQATAQDAVHMFGLRPERLSITGGGVSESFRPPASRNAVRATLRRLRPSIDGEYVLYTGGMDYRKNVDGLLSAYARLPKEPSRSVQASARRTAGARRSSRAVRGAGSVARGLRKSGLRRVRLRRGTRSALSGGVPFRVPLSLRGVRLAGHRGACMRCSGDRRPELVLGRARGR